MRYIHLFYTMETEVKHAELYLKCNDSFKMSSIHSHYFRIKHWQTFNSKLSTFTNMNDHSHEPLCARTELMPQHPPAYKSIEQNIWKYYG